MIPYARQEITDSDIDAVIYAMKSDHLTQGPMVPKFERIVADCVGARYAVAVANATSALHVACLSLGLEQGDLLWSSPISFVASTNCGLYCGASVDFVDICPNTYNICPVKLEEKLISAKSSGKLPKIVVAVHFAGQSCDMEAIHSLSIQFDFRLIEDASHAIGGKYKDSPIGSCRFSDITVFSFHAVKIVTTSEGGMALTNCAVLAERMSLYRSHGITREPKMMTKTCDGPWYYEQKFLGFNYRMSELQAALGISQFDRLESYLRRRCELAIRYNNALAELPLVLPWQHPDCISSWHLYVIRLKSKVINKSHRHVFEYLRKSGVGVNLHYIPIYRHPFYANKGFFSGDYPNAEEYYSEAITLPLFPALSLLQQDEVISKLSQALY